MTFDDALRFGCISMEIYNGGSELKSRYNVDKMSAEGCVEGFTRRWSCEDNESSDEVEGAVSAEGCVVRWWRCGVRGDEWKKVKSWGMKMNGWVKVTVYCCRGGEEERMREEEGFYGGGLKFCWRRLGFIVVGGGWWRWCLEDEDEGGARGCGGFWRWRRWRCDVR